MNVFLWILQVLLAIHTLMGAVWKFSNSEQTVPSLKALPHGMWLTMGALEILCAVCFVLPAINKKMGFLVPIAALFIVAEMLFLCGFHIFSGEVNSQWIYWVVVAIICGFLAYSRFVLKPI